MTRYRDILVVDLLGGIGDLVMALPVIHGLARRHPGARMRVLTHEPGAVLLRRDPAVHEVRTAGRPGAGAEREAVARALAARRPDLAVTTTRYDGIPDLLTASGARCVTDLWRRPPPDEAVTARYLRILHEEGLLDARDVAAAPRVHLTAAEHAAGDRVLGQALAGFGADAGAPPVVLVTDAGMAVKQWPWHRWQRLVTLLAGSGDGSGDGSDGGPDGGHPVLGVTPNPVVPALPPGDLRHLAACFAAVARRGGVVVGGDTGPLRLAAAAGARTVGLFGPTLATRYGLGTDPRQGDHRDLQGLPGCPHRRPTAITEQVCWWDARCPLDAAGPACLADLTAERVAAAVRSLLPSSNDPSAEGARA